MFYRTITTSSTIMAALPAAKIEAAHDLNVVADGIKAILLGPPGSGKGTQVSNVGNSLLHM